MFGYKLIKIKEEKELRDLVVNMIDETKELNAIIGRGRILTLDEIRTLIVRAKTRGLKIKNVVMGTEEYGDFMNILANNFRDYPLRTVDGIKLKKDKNIIGWYIKT